MTRSRSSPHRFRPRYRYRITRLGFHFLFVALFAIIGGSLRGFNLLLVLAGLLIGVIIVQWRQGRAAIRRTRLIRQGVAGTYAGSPMSIRYQVSNVGYWLPIWMLRIDDQLTVEPYSPTDQSVDESDDNGPIPLVGSLGNIPAGQTRSTSIVCRFNHRGRYKIGPTVASTSFPFCLVSCERLSAGSLDQIYVYPRLLDLRRGWETLLPPRRGGDGTRSTGGTNHDGEFFGLRPWQSGDNIKHIHWRTTARIGQPTVRQFEQRNQHQICVVVDGVPSSSEQDAVNEFELVLQLATTLLHELASQSRSVALLLADSMDPDSPKLNRVIESNRADLSQLMQRLAVAKRCHNDHSRIDPLAQAVADVSTDLKHYDIVVVSGRRFADAVDHRPSDTEAHALSVWRFFDRSGRLSWMDVRSPTVKRFLNIASLASLSEETGDVSI